MSKPLTLVSHVLCPYVQRAAIVLMEKGAAFDRVDIDLKNKPPWFLAISPLGKTPVLQVDGQAIFESAVICEFLDETMTPRLHPALPLARAHHRSWVEFGSSVLNGIGAFYNAGDETTLGLKARELRSQFEQVESILGDGPFFSGAPFSIVDAAFAPVFRYFDAFDEIGDFGFFQGLPKVKAWRHHLALRASVRKAVHDDYQALLEVFLRGRHSALSRRMRAPVYALDDAGCGASQGCANGLAGSSM